jgi:hypothetical protein
MSSLAMVLISLSSATFSVAVADTAPPPVVPPPAVPAPMRPTAPNSKPPTVRPQVPDLHYIPTIKTVKPLLTARQKLHVNGTFPNQAPYNVSATGLFNPDTKIFQITISALLPAGAPMKKALMDFETTVEGDFGDFKGKYVIVVVNYQGAELFRADSVR